MVSAESIKLPAGAFYGSKTRDLEVAGLRLTESSYPAGTSLPPHSHEQAHFIVVLAGRYAETIGQMRAQRAAGATLFLPPDIPHEERHHVDGRHFMVEMGRDLLARWQERRGDFACAIDVSTEKAARVTQRLYEEFRQPDAASPLVIEGLVLLLLTLAAERRPANERHTPLFLAQAREFIHDQFAQNFTIETLAETVGVTRWQLTRAFQKHFRCTPGDYLRRQRLEFARRELARPGKKLVAIAHAAGFCDQSHFSRAFKSFTGITPRLYQQQMRRSARARVDQCDTDTLPSSDTDG